MPGRFTTTVPRAYNPLLLYGRRRTDLLTAAALLLFVTIPFVDVLAGMRAFFIRDLSRYYYPTKRIVREVILSGELPVWNPYYSAGQPMAANPEYEVFYPPQWLILLPDYDLGYRLHILVHFWIAVLGAFVLFRGLRLRPGSAALGAIGFALGGFFISTVNLLPIMFCAAWIPAILHFGRRFIVLRKRRDFCFAALLLGVQMLAGEPTTLLQTWAILGFYALWRANRKRIAPRAAIRAMGLVLAMGIGGALVGSAQMIPAADHAGDSIRARGFEFSLVKAWSMTPWRPIELLIPNVFGHIWIDGTLFWGSGLYEGTGSPFYFTIYFGLILTAAAIAHLALRRRGWLMSLLLVAGSILLALGNHTPLLRWLYDAGVFASVRYPEKFSLTALLVLLFIGTISFDAVLRGDRARLKVIAAIAGICVLASAVVLTISFLPVWEPWFRRVWGVKSSRVPLMLDMAQLEWGISLIRGACALALCALLVRRPRLATALTVILSTVDLVWTGRSSVPRVEAQFFTPPPIVDELDRPLANHRIFHEIDWYGSSKIARRYFSAGPGVYWVVRNGIYPMMPAAWGIRTVLERDYDRTALLPTVDLVAAMWRVRDSGQKQWRDIFMSMSNARYVSEYFPFEEEWKRTRGRLRNSEPVRFRRTDVEWPRYYFAGEMRRADSLDAFVEDLAAREWSASEARARPAVYTALAPRALHAGVVKRAWERSSSFRARVRVEDGGEGLFVAAVTPHKYWRASVDGRAVPIHTTNVGYMSVFVPAGEHEVEFRYHNPLVIWFSLLSLVSAIVLSALSFRAGRGPA